MIERVLQELLQRAGETTVPDYRNLIDILADITVSDEDLPAPEKRKNEFIRFGKRSADGSVVSPSPPFFVFIHTILIMFSLENSENKTKSVLCPIPRGEYSTRTLSCRSLSAVTQSNRYFSSEMEKRKNEFIRFGKRKNEFIR